MSAQGLGPTAATFYQDVPISSGIVPVWNTFKAQEDDFNRFKVGSITRSIYIDYNRGYVDVRPGDFSDEKLFRVNYISFTNPFYENKKFFCKITGYQKIANSVTRISFVVDAFQTFMFDFKMFASHIERQHLSEPQWLRAVENPYRSDIQELTTDEGVSVNSADEVSYQRPPGLRTGAKRYNGPKDSIGEEWDGKALVPDGYPGLITAVGASSDEPVNKDTDYIIMAYSKYPTTSNKNGGAPYPYFTKVMQNKSTKNDKPWTAIQFISSMFPGDDVEFGIVYPGGQNSMLTGALSMDYGSFSTPTNWHDGLMQSLNKVYTQKEMIQGFYKVPEEYALSMVANTNMTLLGAALGKETVNLLKNFQCVTEVNIKDYNDIPGYGEVVDPKLRRSPYRYIRLVSPKGDDKEFPIENFGNAKPKFMQVFYPAAAPEFSVMPQNYLGKSNDELNRLTVNGFGQVAWHSNGFSDYIRNKNRDAILGETQSAQRARDEMTVLPSEKGDDNGGVWGSVKRGVQNASDFIGNSVRTVGAAFTGDVQGATQKNLEVETRNDALNQAQESYKTGNLMSGPGDSYGGVYSHQRSALIGRGEYHPGRGSGFTFANKLVAFEAVCVTLQPYIIHGLDVVFQHYGYRCDYFALPRVFDYMRQQDEAPHWVNRDGVTFTYCKTKECSVFGLAQPFCDEISAVFNAGQKFTKGLIK